MSPIDQFGLDSGQFVAAQLEVPWIRALVAFLLDGALPLDPYLRISSVFVLRGWLDSLKKRAVRETGNKQC